MNKKTGRLVRNSVIFTGWDLETERENTGRYFSASCWPEIKQKKMVIWDKATISVMSEFTREKTTFWNRSFTLFLYWITNYYILQCRTVMDGNYSAQFCTEGFDQKLVKSLSVTNISGQLLHKERSLFLFGEYQRFSSYLRCLHAIYVIYTRAHTQANTFQVIFRKWDDTQGPATIKRHSATVVIAPGKTIFRMPRFQFYGSSQGELRRFVYWPTINILRGTTRNARPAAVVRRCGKLPFQPSQKARERTDWMLLFDSYSLHRVCIHDKLNDISAH